MKDSARYAKVVEWSKEDGCYIGSAPGLIYGACHGDDEQAVFGELCQIVDEWIEIYGQDGTPLPPQTAGRVFERDFLDQELSALQNFWSAKAKEKGVLTEGDLERLLRK